MNNYKLYEFAPASLPWYQTSGQKTRNRLGLLYPENCRVPEIVLSGISGDNRNWQLSADCSLYVRSMNCLVSALFGHMVYIFLGNKNPAGAGSLW